jgi:hypothetical protein
MLSKRLSFPFCAAFIALSLTAVPAFTQTARSRHNTAVDESTDSKATSQSLPPDWDPAVVLDATTDWIGNTWGGNNPSYPNNTLFHVPLDMNNIYVTPDGRVFSNTDWDEGGRAISVFNKNGAMISRLNDQNNSPDWNNAVGNAVASDGHYIFASNGNGSTGLGIFDASNVYNTGLSLTGSSTVYNSQIFGLAIAKGLLYVAENETNQGVPVNLVEVFNISTLALVNTFADISNPVRITADRSGGFWVSHMGPTVPFDYFAQQGLATVDHYDSAGNYVNTITLPDGGEVGALAFNNYSGALLVGDNGPDENIKIYANLETNPTLVGTFGEKGGVYAGPVSGRTGPLRFRGITGIGTDAEGNIYVSESGWGLDFGNGEGVVLQSYTWWGDLNWERQGLEFVSLGNIDPHSETDLYDAHHHFKIDYSKSGRVDTYYADTYNGYLWPQDVRLTSVMNMGELKYIQGKKFLVARSQNETRLEIYRFEGDSEVGIPCVAFDYGLWQDNPQNLEFIVQPADGDEFIWRDVNGDGKMTNGSGGLDPAEFFEPSPADGHRNADNFYLDDNGDMWQQNYGDNDPNIYWRRYYFQGFDAHGSPIYDFQHMAIYTVGAGLDFPDLTEVDMVVFDPHASKGGTLFAFGSVDTQIVRYDNWDLGNRKATWSKNLITSGDIQNYWHPDNFDVAGDFIFVSFDGSTGSSNGTWSNHYIQVYSAKTGVYVGRFVAGHDVGGMANLGNTDESHALSAYKRSNGEYVLIREEDFQAKLVMFRWTPPDPLPVPKAPAPVGVTGTPDDEAFTLSWPPQPKALSYTISSGPNSTGPFVPQSTGLYGVDSASVVGLTNGTTDGYTKLTVFYRNGASADSQPFQVSAVQKGISYGVQDPTLVLAGPQIGTNACSLCYDGQQISAVVQGTSMTWSDVVVPTTGTYNLRLYEENGQCGPCWGLPPGSIGPTINVTVNGAFIAASPQLPQTDPNGGWGTPAYVTVQVPLITGQNNTIELWVPADAPSGDPNFDRILVPFAPAS